MIIKNEKYWIISRNSNTDYWGQDASPQWTAIGSFIYHPSQKTGAGVEPHYHDADEIWIFRCGRGEAWIDGQSYEVTPNTVVYTPMGSVHRFQMFTDFDNASIVTRLERQERINHLLVEQDGPPVPTVPGFVVAGGGNDGPIPNRGTRCNFTELGTVQFEPGDGLEQSRLNANEHWVVASGALRLAVDGLEVELLSGDIAMMRAGALRAISCPAGAQAFLARE
jgi:mannose-6-phosphate isomerase-like protein (cupin superfamily)